MTEWKARKEAVNKCMGLYDKWMESANGSPKLVEVVWFQTKALAAHECAALIARCNLDSPLVSTDPAVRDKAWSDLLSR